MESNGDKWAADIHILRIKMIDTAGALKGVVDIKLGPLTIRGLRIIEDGNGMWVSWPQDRFRTPGGFFRYLNIVQPTPEIAEAVTQSIMEMWEKNCRPFLDG